MRILICVVGTRGDVQPTIALAKGLLAAGHEVRLFTHDMFADLAHTHGIDFMGIAGDPTQGMLRTAVAEIGNNPVRLARWLRENFKPVLRELFSQTLHAAEGHDLIVSASASLAAFHVAEKLGIPAISAQLWPTTVTRHQPGALIPLPPSWLPGKGLYNMCATKIGNQAIFQILRPLSNGCRREVLGLPPLGARYWWTVDGSRSEVPTIYGYSTVVAPRPADWGPNKRISGYWFLDGASGYKPSTELEAFLAQGPPPVFVGMGSVIDHDPQTLSRIVVEAVARVGCRAVLQSGWSGHGATELPDSVFVVNDVPHDWLFPRMAAAVHHGGAGTTAEGLRSGLPTVIVPFYADQFFWAWRVRELGVGPRSLPRGLPRRRLTAERLASAVTEIFENERIRATADEIGRRIRAEDGVANAVADIEEFAGQR